MKKFIIGIILLAVTLANCTPCPAQTTNKQQPGFTITTNETQIIGFDLIQLPTPSATATNGMVYVQWTQSPTNDYFDVIVERSTDMQEWEPVMVKEIMSSPVPLLYCTIDQEAPSGTVYYRLQRFEQITKLYGTSKVVEAASVRPPQQPYKDIPRTGSK